MFGKKWINGDLFMMVNIDVLMLEDTLKMLNNTIADYEEVNRNIFNTLKQSSFFWNDGVARNFFDSLDNQQNNDMMVINNLKENKELISYMVNSYLVIGKKIKCNLNSKDTISSKIKEILQDISSTLSIYNRLDTSFCPYERNLLNKEKNNLIQVYNSLNTMFSEITKSFNKIEEIEKNVNSKIEKLNDYVVEKFSYDEYIKD